MRIKIIIFLFIALLLSGFTVQFPISLPITDQKNWLDREMILIRSNTPKIDNKILRLSLLAYAKAQAKGLITKPYLTVIDYTKPSTEKRLWIFDLKTGKTLFNTWVSHGKNSGELSSTSFSNVPGSLKSSIGVFVTDLTYIGGNGYSLRLRGLERGFNDNAYQRSIVMHGARYVNPDTIRRYGRIGRSWGCPAVRNDMARPLIDTIKNKTLVFAYYPDRKWLTQSQFLAG